MVFSHSESRAGTHRSRGRRFSRAARAVYLGLLVASFCQPWPRMAGAQLAMTPYHLLHGPGRSGCFGSAVCGVRDIDLDGFDDFAVGGPSECTVGPYPAGVVRLYSGLSGALLHELSEPVPLSGFGAAVTGTSGPMFGATSALILVGAPKEPTPMGQGTGAVYAFSITDGALVLRLDANGAGSGFQQFGRTIELGGDIDGDGSQDILVGSPDLVGAGSGAAYAFSGADGSLLFRIQGPANHTRFGAAVLGAGDLNSDNHADLLVGDPSQGVVLAYSGLDQGELYSIQGPASFGTSLALVGDLDGDGTGDFCAGAPFANQNGEVSCVSADSGYVLSTKVGSAAYSDFGASLARLGDIDGDGDDDLAVGAPSEGRPIGCCFGAFYVFSPIDNAIVQRFGGGSVQFTAFGGSLAGCDTNADGVTDLLVGTPATLDTLGLATGLAAVIGFVEPTAARVFTRPQDTVVPLGAGNGTNQFRIEPPTLGAWDAAKIAPGTAVLRPSAFDYTQLSAFANTIGEDTNGNAIPEAVLSFRRTEVREFLKELGDDTVSVEAALLTGERIRGLFTFSVIDPEAPRFTLAPNPAGAVATLTLRLTRPGYVTIRIFDVAGRLARRVAEREWMLAGYNDRSLDLSGSREPHLASGVYIIQVSTDSGSSFRRLAVVR